MKHLALALLLLLCLALLGGCGGGQEIESCLFVLAMSVDPAPDGALTVTVKALSGTQEAAAPAGEQEQPGGQGAPSAQESSSGVETAEPGYIVLSATAPSCLRALSLLSATTPRTVNLSQLREIVLSRTLCESGAALSILKEIHAMYRANGEAIVVVTPDDAGDFIRRQRPILGVRLSQYLEGLFEHFSQIDTIPPNAQLSAVIEAMQSDAIDAAAVYAAANSFDSTLMLPESDELNRLPGHLPRTSPARNEYLGTALFSGARMVGTLTGEETGLLCLMLGRAQRGTAFIGNAQYRIHLPTRVRRTIGEDGALCVRISMSLMHAAGEEQRPAPEIAADIERECAALLLKLRAAGCDAVGFGRLAIRRCLTLPQWQAMNWPSVYAALPVRVSARVKVL